MMCATLLEPMVLRRVGFAVAVLLALAATPPDPLVRARQFYNQQQYDAAIAAAREAQRRPNLADAAGVVLARAHLERYRISDEAADLAAARETLPSIDVSRLVPADRRDLTIGFGELLYFDGRFGAAAEMFGAALGGPDPLAAPTRELVLDWWAIALDREAQTAADRERRRIYERILQHMEGVLLADRESASAIYWLAAAAAGTDDPDRAWDAAVAGWIRAPLGGGRRASLRADLERLVLELVIPRRARLAPGGDVALATTAMLAEWAAIKEMGSRR
jgi:hypothetical protein